MNDPPRIQDEGTMGLAAWTGETRGMASAHQHLDLEINFVLSGAMRYLVGGRVIDVPCRKLCLLWGGVPHQMIRDVRSVEAIWVTIPLARVLRWGLPDPLIRPLLATGFVSDPVPRPGDLELLHQWIIDLPGKSEPARVGRKGLMTSEIVLLEIEARLRRLALGISQQPEEDRPTTQFANQNSSVAHIDRGLAAVEAMAQRISHNFQDDIGVAEIAEAAHLHPNYAMTVFREHTGMTISQYLTLQRIAHAQRLLATTSDSIPEIAGNSGFRSLSRFYEAFRQQTGNSPRRFRLHLESERRSLP